MIENFMLRIATRKSPLALQQAHHVADQLKKYWPHLSIELVPMSTQGDQLLDKKLLHFGGKGLFVKELEHALLENRADIAVHSMKDVPAILPNGLQIFSFCKRDNPFDAFISLKFKNLEEIPAGSVIGTASLRRQAQILAYRPELKVETLRGNIHTRLKHLEQEQYDAIILACAGLERMGMTNRIQQRISKTLMLPACGQGAIGIECRSQDEKIKKLIEVLHCEKTAICVKVEREVNRLLGGHCHVPIAIYAYFIDAEHLHLEARIYHPNGQKKLLWQNQFSAHQAFDEAKICAQTLLKQGALELLKDEG
jgi:hydroxymethylbilane synthase